MDKIVKSPITIRDFVNCNRVEIITFNSNAYNDDEYAGYNFVNYYRYDETSDSAKFGGFVLVGHGEEEVSIYDAIDAINSCIRNSSKYEVHIIN